MKVASGSSRNIGLGADLVCLLAVKSENVDGESPRHSPSLPRMVFPHKAVCNP